jgi:hypothetical protein
MNGLTLTVRSGEPALKSGSFIRSRRAASLLDMLRFYAKDFALAMGYLSAIEQDCRYEVGVDSDAALGHVAKLDASLKSLALPLSIRQLERIKEKLEAQETSALADAIYQLRLRVYDELESRLLLVFDGNKAEYYDDLAPFGEDVFSNFPSVNYDAEQASKCFSLGQNTACVFHLSRVADVGLRTLSRKLGIESHNPSWDSILKKIDAELKKDYKDIDPEWKKDEDFFAESSLHLRSYKNSRNNTQHADKKYTGEEAERIFTAVKVLMQHLATKLVENEMTLDEILDSLS